MVLLPVGGVVLAGPQVAEAVKALAPHAPRRGGAVGPELGQRQTLDALGIAAAVAGTDEEINGVGPPPVRTPYRSSAVSAFAVTGGG